jgi:hypothetical protein
VTHLRQIMLEELTRRNYAESTIQIYEFAMRNAHGNSPPHQDAPRDGKRDAMPT